jgi:transcription-repair coupling factor (superfamily II helicase)
MNLSGLLPLIQSMTALAPVLARLRRPAAAGPPLVLGLPDTAKAATLATLAQGLAAPLLVLAARPDRARALAEELAVWLGDESRVVLFPERDALPYERLVPDPEAVSHRLRVVSLLAEEAEAAPSASLRAGPIVVASAQAAAQRTLAPAELAQARETVAVGSRLEPESFLRRLSASGGYRFLPLVEEAGQASRRGGIIDVFPPTADLPLRIELVGDRVESLRRFDPASQRSVARVESEAVGPAREVILPPVGLDELRRGLDFARCSPDVSGRFHEELSTLEAGGAFIGDSFYVPFLAQGTLFDFLPLEAVLVCDQPSELAAALDELEAQALEVRAELEQKGELPPGLPLPHLAWREVAPRLDEHPRRTDLSRWATGEEEGSIRLPFEPAPAYGGRLRNVVSEAVEGRRSGRRFVIVSQQAARLADLFAEQDVSAGPSAALTEPPPAGSVAVVQGSLPGGWLLAAEGQELLFLTDTEVFGFTKQRRALPRRGIDRGAFLAELKPGDFVVHVEHGIARFAGMARKAIEGHEREYLELHYAEGDRLFVPIDQLHRVSRYVGPGEHVPTLTRLGSQEWARTKERVRRAVADLARELLALYAAREVLSGHAFSPDSPWQLELEASFPYVETPDQLLAIRQVKQDMEQPRPMDRLVCGDVGYGKTEVAIRAAFKAVLDGMQVAMLVPTTVLAQQHFQTLSERLAAFPLRVEMLSRFRSEAEQRRVLADLADGAVDIVIGTHRLIQKDVQFKNLGLAIIDEEQRFGVAHKEHLKQMRREVDVLTLSATPIPRTLYMSLGGIRDMSTMDTPPEERLAIKTYVAEFDERLIREAILREVDRGGQVYFVHNRVQSIDSVARRLREVVPEAEIAVAHGQMPEQMLEQVMLDFVRGRVDVLACTTIIESGLDIPNVNTIIINQADKLGLAQLYQLRGRVGRGAQLAYAYLLYDRRGRLTETAQRRLQTIFEATELGAGFQIALRDLEIRGAGNLLGAEQSGHMAAVGFDLYCQMLAEAVEGLRAVKEGLPPPPPREGPEVTIDLPLSAHLPESYVPDLNLRLALYQRMAQMESVEQVEELARELRDRFQAPPPLARNLLYVVRLRVLAMQAGVESISSEDGQIVVRLKEGRQLPAESAFGGRLPEGAHVGRTQLRLERRRLGPAWPQALQRVLEELAGAMAGARA